MQFVTITRLYLNVHKLKDEAKARYWLEKSAQQGYAESQYKLAMIYFDEKGRFGHDADAVKWFKKAGSNGVAKGYTMAAVMYLDGRGVAKSRFQALRYSILTLKSGDLDAGKVIDD